MRLEAFLTLVKFFQAKRLKHDDTSCFHRFVSGENERRPIQVYKLTNVTFSDNPSSTAGIVALRHIVVQHSPGDETPRIIVTDQFYMDYLNESVLDIKQVLDLKNKLTETLKKGNFAIMKWQSNAPWFHIQ